MLKEYDNFRSKTSILNETHNAYDRDSRIKKATSQGNITFMTRSFGRGTDFILFDKNILKKGGLHIIQTFISEERSEEV